MNDPLEERLRRLAPAPLPEEVLTALSSPPARRAPGGRRIIRIAFGVAAAAAAAVAVLMHYRAGEAVDDDGATPTVADTSSRRVEDARPLAVIAEGQRAWELVEVKWVDENVLTSAAGTPVAVQTSAVHRTIVPVEIMLD